MVNIVPISIPGPDGEKIIVQVNQKELPRTQDAKARAAFLARCQAQARDKVTAATANTAESK